MIFVLAVDGEANRTDKTTIFTVGIDANKGWVLTMGMTIVRFDEILEALGELLDVCLNRHQLKIYFISMNESGLPVTQIKLHQNYSSEVYLYPVIIKDFTSQSSPFSYYSIAAKVDMLETAI